MSQRADRYSSVAIALHWLIAALLIMNVVIGGRMEDARGPARAIAFMWHESVGITVLVLTLVRIFWRLGHPIPALPAAMAAWEKFLARTVQTLFYVMLLTIPLLGWAAASSGRFGVAPLFGKVPFFNLPVPHDHALHEMLGDIHTALVKATYVLIALHVLGALKHYFLDKNDVAARMLPFLRSRGV